MGIHIYNPPEPRGNPTGIEDRDQVDPDGVESFANSCHCMPSVWKLTVPPGSTDGGGDYPEGNVAVGDFLLILDRDTPASTVSRRVELKEWVASLKFNKLLTLVATATTEQSDLLPSGTQSTIHMENVVGGTFAIELNGSNWPDEKSAYIPYNATAGEIQAALQAMSNVPAGSVSVTGGPLPLTDVRVYLLNLYGEILLDSSRLSPGVEVFDGSVEGWWLSWGLSELLSAHFGGPAWVVTNYNSSTNNVGVVYAISDIQSFADEDPWKCLGENYLPFIGAIGGVGSPVVDRPPQSVTVEPYYA